ncbi:MAG TPA: AAA family ATPase, partial [Conexibacter sp.]|nr:AAA family ATPase [Conexibacter sp.]
MRIVRLAMRNFRSYAAAEVELGPGVTVVTGRNGAGKTNLLDALYFGCTGRSARTTNERELVRFGEQVVRVEVTTEAPDGLHELSVGFTPGEPKRMTADGVRVERLLDVPGRPLVS